MKDKKKTSHNFTYVTQLLANLVYLMGISFLIYGLAQGQLFIVYIFNALFIIGVLIEEKFWNKFHEKMYYKLKKGGWVKQRFKEMLVSASRKPSMKVVLYVYYLICIIAERLFYFGVAKDVMAVDILREYLSIMYYAFILLMAIDKVREVMSKDKNYRKKHYAKFGFGEEQLDELK